MITHPWFTENKYWRWYNSIVKRAIDRPPEDGEYHHTVPRCMGGQSSLIVKLTYREHFLCHWLLTKFVEGAAWYKLQRAFGMMVVTGGNLDRKLTSWQYAKARKALSLGMQNNKNSLGYKHTAETRKRLSLVKLGNKHTLGYRHTPESSLKMSNAQLGNKKFLGKKHSEETKLKMRLAAARRPRNKNGTYTERKAP